ncbi:metal transporter [Steroidobacter agaridevorans]|uniref:Metal transporter n=1 Tax=Steroidobacter agaridevorans TaxID=2695856 RepID=A0A829YIC8_9GAMM|nr:TolC family protein [Steroidobacter agaridevorans]GFE82990.1 metal transporter [Steroidobacter agaridevorans]
MLLALARACAACVLLFSCSANAESQAEPVNPEGELTLARAVDAALRSNPDLLASAYELSAAQARIVQASVRPNPELGMELENFAGGGAAQGIDSLETTLSLSQVVELGGKRNLRRAAAEADLDFVDIEQRTRELDVLSNVTSRFIDVVAAQERVRFAIQATALAQSTLEAIGARVEAGRSPEAERSRARIALTRALIEQRQAESELRAARYALSASWGSPEPAFTTARAELFDLRTVESFQALMDRLEKSPDFVRFASEARLREAELRLARVQARPNLTFSVGVRRFEQTDDAALVAGFSMPLSIYDRNQGAIREAQIRLDQTDALRNAARVRARASLLALYQEMNTDRSRVDTLRNEAIPQAQLALDQTRNGYDRGRFSFLELITVQEELLAVQAAAIDAAADFHRVLAEIERLTSAALTRPSSP